jgi:hypothetical protein
MSEYLVIPTETPFRFRTETEPSIPDISNIKIGRLIMSRKAITAVFLGLPI